MASCACILMIASAMRLAPGTRWSFRSLSPRSCCSATPPLSSPTYLITQNKTVSVVTVSYYLVDFTAGSADADASPASECTGVRHDFVGEGPQLVLDRLAIDIGGPAAACGHAVLPAGMAM